MTTKTEIYMLDPLMLNGTRQTIWGAYTSKIID